MKKLNKTELSEAFRVSTNTISEWVKKGCPHEKGDGTSWRFDLPSVVEWRVLWLLKSTPSEEGVPLAEARRRKTLAEAGLRELELKTAEGQYIHIDSLNIVDKMILNCKTRLLAIPRKAAPQVLGCNNSLPQIEDKLTEIVYDALTELAELDPADFLEAEKK